MSENERVLTFGETAQATYHARGGRGCWCNRDLSTTGCSRDGTSKLAKVYEEKASRQGCFFTRRESLINSSSKLWMCFRPCIGSEVWSGHRPAYRNLARGFAGARRSLRAVGLQLSERCS